MPTQTLPGNRITNDKRRDKYYYSDLDHKIDSLSFMYSNIYMLFFILLLVGVSGSCIVLPTEIRIFAYKQDCIRHGYPNQLTCPDSWKLHQELKQTIPNYPNQVRCESTKICCIIQGGGINGGSLYEDEGGASLGKK